VTYSKLCFWRSKSERLNNILIIMIDFFLQIKKQVSLMGLQYKYTSSIGMKSRALAHSPFLNVLRPSSGFLLTLPCVLSINSSPLYRTPQIPMQCPTKQWPLLPLSKKTCLSLEKTHVFISETNIFLLLHRMKNTQNKPSACRAWKRQMKMDWEDKKPEKKH
jgi:hypothetical protein